VPIVTDSTISNNQYGIYNEWGGGITIATSTISNNSNHGIYLSSPRKPVTITNSIISNNSNYGIYFSYPEQGSSLTVSDSTISNNSGPGIAIKNPQTALAFTITNNTISNNSGDGLYYQNSSIDYVSSPLPSITYNPITGNSDDGIELNGSHAVATINYNNLYENSGSYDLRSSVTYQEIDARYNYWGLSSTAIMGIATNPKDIPRIYDYHNNVSYSLVNYAAWLSEAY